MKNKRYLLLAVIGAVLPMAFFVQHFSAAGLAPGSFLAAAFANPAAAGLSADLIVSSVVFWVWLFARRQGPSPWPFVALNLLVGLSLALPLYLWWQAGSAGD